MIIALICRRQDWTLRPPVETRPPLCPECRVQTAAFCRNYCSNLLCSAVSPTLGFADEYLNNIGQHRWQAGRGELLSCRGWLVVVEVNCTAALQGVVGVNYKQCSPLLQGRHRSIDDKLLPCWSCELVVFSLVNYWLRGRGGAAQPCDRLIDVKTSHVINTEHHCTNQQTNK